MGTETNSTENPKRPGTIDRVSYGVTVNIGNFETVRFDLSAQVTLDEKWQDVLERIRALCDKQKQRILKDGY